MTYVTFSGGDVHLSPAVLRNGGIDVESVGQTGKYNRGWLAAAGTAGQ